MKRAGDEGPRTRRVGLLTPGLVAVGLVIGATVPTLDTTTRTLLGLTGAGTIFEVTVLALYPSDHRHRHRR